jgi:hypothetical protein
MSDTVLGVLILIVVTPVLYFVGRTAGMIGDAWSARLLAPLAPAIGGIVDQSGPCVRGRYQGRDVRVSFTTRQNVGSGESATWINAFHIEVTELAGRQDWRLKFHQKGFFGPSQKELYIEVKDEALGQRLERAGVLAEVAAVSAPTDCYVTVEYEARRKVLTFTDDVSPRRVPSHEQFTAQLLLVARLAEINEQVNPV